MMDAIESNYNQQFDDLLLQPMAKYLLRLQTKLQLYDNLTSDSFAVFWESFLLAQSRYMSDFSRFISKVISVILIRKP